MSHTFDDIVNHLHSQHSQMETIYGNRNWLQGRLHLLGRSSPSPCFKEIITMEDECQLETNGNYVGPHIIREDQPSEYPNTF
uniref:Ovule protein n=1 Tax=Angiostrongylus cantonensis TaxID=6313 RepID=A0A0K0DPH3_ANGCA